MVVMVVTDTKKLTIADAWLRVCRIVCLGFLTVFVKEKWIERCENYG